MKVRTIPSFSLILFVLVFNMPLHAQFNIKVGYRGGYSEMNAVNDIVNRFNEKYFTLEDKLDNFRFIHGLELGLRYKIGATAFEIGWCNQTDRSDVVGKLPSGANFQDKWFLSFTEYALGFETYIGEYFGYGASIGSTTLRFKTDIAGARRKTRVASSDHAYNSRFYLLYQYPGYKVSIAFKPYVQFPWNQYNVRDFDQDLNSAIDPEYVAPDGQKERFMIYGLSVLLYNGRQ